jgi:HK97 family phage prohead protease
MTEQTLNFKLEIKALNAREFEGYGSTFGNVDLGDDIVMSGAFAKTLADHRAAGALPPMFWMHNPEAVPGKWMSMEEDEQGLFVKGTLADTQLGNETRELLKMKAVRGLSIGYRARAWEYEKRDNHLIRLLKEVDLWEVSVVSLAMNPLAMVEHAKSRLSREGEYVPTEREMEHYLEQKFSKRVARTMISKLFDKAHDGGMPDGRRWDAANAENIDGDAASVLGSIASLTDRFTAELFRTR